MATTSPGDGRPYMEAWRGRRCEGRVANACVVLRCSRHTPNSQRRRLDGLQGPAYAKRNELQEVGTSAGRTPQRGGCDLRRLATEVPACSAEEAGQGIPLVCLHTAGTDHGTVTSSATGDQRESASSRSTCCHGKSVGFW